MSNWVKECLDFLQIDEDTIRFFVYGGTGAIVTGVAEEKKKTMIKFCGLAFVGATMSAFFSPALINYYHIDNIKYQMVIGFIIGIGSMIIVGKLLRAIKAFKMPLIGGAKEGEDDASV